jgi:NADH:ubiquinone oxidoreductase subunit 3 (subunit A)
MSTGAGAIGLVLLFAIGLPAATLGLARLLAARAGSETTAVAAPAMVPSWLRLSIESYLAALLLAVLDVAVLFVVVWAVAVHVLDAGYALAEILLLVVLLAGGGACVWARGLRSRS